MDAIKNALKRRDNVLGFVGCMLITFIIALCMNDDFEQMHQRHQNTPIKIVEVEDPESQEATDAIVKSMFTYKWLWIDHEAKTAELRKQNRAQWAKL